MQPLDKTLRNRLERTIKDARDIAEDAARAALEQLGVGEAAPFTHLSEQERDLRRKLRVHGRQLGDSLNGGKTQTLERLTEEVAYQHWHRMLFARFLAENNLLMYPDPGDPVAVTLEECEDLAADEGVVTGWELAARFAARMLPQIFRLDSPVFQLTLPPEHQQKLERLVADLPLDVFTASDSLGWVYQFWQAKKKDEVNASEIKIGARELPAVTQLFTEPYMVSFLLDNSLGAWWAARRLSNADLQNADSEQELREKAAIPGVSLNYLRFIKQEDGAWTPAAGTFDGWPKHLADLKTLDPCCGSGHFLVAALLMLVPMRMELEGLNARQAVDAVIRDNIHGLELDQRCVELAAFALALTAWKYPSAGGYRVLPGLNVACSGLSINAKKEEWLALARDNTNLRIGLEELYKQFKDAPVLGSLINPETSLDKEPLFVKWGDVGPLLTKAMDGEKDDVKNEIEVVAKGIAKAADILTQRYCWVITNVPYLARGKQDEALKTFCETHYPEAKNDLANVFLERCLELALPPLPLGEGRGEGQGVVQIVMPQNWLFLTSYKKQRESLLKRMQWNLLARLGEGGFDSPQAAGAFIILLTQTRAQAAADFQLHGVDASAPKKPEEKARLLREGALAAVSQQGQLGNPDVVVSLAEQNICSRLGQFARSLAGLDNGDTLQFRFVFWEMIRFGRGWVYQVNAAQNTAFFDGREHILRWDDGKGNLVRCPGARLSNIDLWGSNGVYVSRMRDLPATLCLGTAWDRNGTMIVPHDRKILKAIWVYCSSNSFTVDVRKLNQKLSVAEATFENIPFDLEHWAKVADEKYPHGLPQPYSDDPSQWLFHGHPCGSVIWDEDKKWTVHGELRIDDTVLQVAVARLLGYKWPAEFDADMELADEQRQWVKRCEALASFADGDGIVCIPPVRGETPASDRLLNLLAAAYNTAPPLAIHGEGGWGGEVLAALLKSVDHTGKTLETWLREKFFTQHCKLFQHRPFIWHIWDGLRDGFAALVNYHKLDYKNLETLIYTYLGDWISRQKQDMANQVDGAEEKLAAAENLKKKLELILEGEAPYDIFVRWKPIEEQPIGWNPDLNDGVRLNIRPFMSVPDTGKKGAGTLRDKPNINWNKDRGKDVPSAPWYHLGPQYGGKEGDRINDHHLTLAEKRAARSTQGETL